MKKSDIIKRFSLYNSKDKFDIFYRQRKNFYYRYRCKKNDFNRIQNTILNNPSLKDLQNVIWQIKFFGTTTKS